MYTASTLTQPCQGEGTMSSRRRRRSNFYPISSGLVIWNATEASCLMPIWFGFEQLRTARTFTIAQPDRKST